MVDKFETLTDTFDTFDTSKWSSSSPFVINGKYLLTNSSIQAVNTYDLQESSLYFNFIFSGLLGLAVSIELSQDGFFGLALNYPISTAGVFDGTTSVDTTITWDRTLNWVKIEQDVSNIITASFPSDGVTYTPAYTSTLAVPLNAARLAIHRGEG